MHNSTFLKILRSRNLQEVQDYITLCISDIQMLQIADSDIQTKRAIKLLEYQQAQLEKRKNFLLKSIKMKQIYDENRRQKAKIEGLRTQVDYTNVLESEIEKIGKKNQTLKTQLEIHRIAGRTQFDVEMANSSPEMNLFAQELDSLVKQGLSVADALKSITKKRNSIDYQGTIDSMMKPENLSPELQNELNSMSLDQVDFSIMTEVEHSTKTDPMIVSESEFQKLKQIEEEDKIKSLDTGVSSENSTNHS